MTAPRLSARIRQMGSLQASYKDGSVYPDGAPRSEIELVVDELNRQSFSSSDTAAVDSVLVKALYVSKLGMRPAKDQKHEEGGRTPCTGDIATDLCCFLDDQTVMSKSAPTVTDAFTLSTMMAAMWPHTFQKSQVPVIQQCVT